MESSAYRAFKSQYESLIRSKSAHTIFDEFLDYALLCFKAYRNEEENNKLAADKDVYMPLFISFGEACGDNSSDDGCYDFEDPLGDLFMEYLSHGRNGQFFTPVNICIMMQKMTLGDDMEEKKLCDPACGSGRTLMASGLQNRNLWLYGSDIDLRCVKMTTLNMLIHTMRGEVAWMDTIAMKHWKSYHIHRVNIGGMMLSTWTETGPGETHFIERLKNSMKAKDEQPIQKEESVNDEQTAQADKKGQLILF